MVRRASLEAAETTEEIRPEKGVRNPNPKTWDLNPVFFSSLRSLRETIAFWFFKRR
jgi:hypothetical protein